jgi:hypothetical protein
MADEGLVRVRSIPVQSRKVGIAISISITTLF